MNGMDGEGEGSGEGSGEEESLRPWERAPPTESLAETDTTRASAPESLGASAGEETGKGRSSGCVIHACAPCRAGALSRTASVPSTASNAADQMVENLLLGGDASNSIFALALPFVSSRMLLAFAVCKTHRPRTRYRSVRTAFDHERLRCTPFKDLDAQPLHFGRSTAGDVGDEATSAGGVEPAMPVATNAATNAALCLAGVELPSGGGWRHQNRGAGHPALQRDGVSGRAFVWWCDNCLAGARLFSYAARLFKTLFGFWSSKRF